MKNAVLLKVWTISTGNSVIVKFLLANGNYDVVVANTEEEAFAKVTLWKKVGESACGFQKNW